MMIATKSKLRISATLCLAWAVLAAAESPAPGLELTVAGLRNEEGKLSICVTADRRHFPDCAGDPKAVTRTLSADQHTASFDLPEGVYAVSLIHDENGNGKLDKLFGIPREGFAFSRNPAIRFGPPRYDEASITVSGLTRATLRVRYLL